MTAENKELSGSKVLSHQNTVPGEDFIGYKNNFSLLTPVNAIEL